MSPQAGAAQPNAIIQALRATGRIREAGSNAPVLLEEPDDVWAVLEGKVDVFAVPVHDGRAGGPRDYLFSASAGDVLFGMEPEWADEVGLLAIGGVGASVSRTTIDEFQRLAHRDPADACALIDQYVLNFAEAVSRRGTPRLDVLLEPGQDYELSSGADLAAKRGVVWVNVEGGPLLFDAYRTLPFRVEDGPFPLGAGAWAHADADIAVSVVEARDVMENGSIWNGLQSFHRITLEWAQVILLRDEAESRAQLQARLEADQLANTTALSDLANIMSSGEPPAEDAGGDGVMAACRLVAKALDIELKAAGAWEAGGSPMGAVRAIARASSVGHRQVVLTPGWWEHDQGPLLGFVAEQKTANASEEDPGHRAGATSADGQETRVTEFEESWEDGRDDTQLIPVALLPTHLGAYELVDPRSQIRVPVDEATAATLGPFGFQFYRGLPATKVTVKDVWAFVTFGVRNDAQTIIALGIAGAILGLLAPLLTGYLFDTVIPGADRLGLINVFVALAVATLSGAAFELTRGISVLRLHTRVGAALQMAVLDRLIRLPLPFYGKFSAGDLGTRASSVNAIGDALSGATLSAILSSFVSAASYVLLFYYSVTLALLATLILIVNVIFSAGTGYFMLRYAREQQEAQGKLSGLVLQLLDGIAKLRVSGTEARAFARWAKAYRREQAVAFRVGLFSNNVGVFNSVLSIGSTLAIFWAYTVLAADPAGGITTGQFIAFNAAFGAFIGSGMQLSQTAISLLGLIPLWERAKPILETEPEVDVSKPDPGELSGRIEVSHLTFRYSPDGPVILDDVSFEAAPGEFIALVGPSGAGKSTALRVLLGFEQAEGSSVFFDGHDLASVDVTAVRRQVGVVLQSSSLTSGDIFSNIVGSASLTIEDAWEAARMAGMEDDLKAMPMGMHTVVTEGGGTLSGGQRQRLLIARSLVTRPRILYFDEATSALDNRTQAIVSESIEGLHATRIVIAHRLSTIREADRIYVFDSGRIVERGSYGELVARDGLFAELVARQEM
jgi:NHLM bacteriocin system ABC transporter ATP-binding protein